MANYIKKAAAILLCSILLCSLRAQAIPMNSGLVIDDNILAWAFLDFDTEERSPQERAKMLKQLGFSKCGYEGHPRYIEQLEEHIIAYRENGIELVGIYLEIREENSIEQNSIKEAINILERQNCKTQLWLTINDELLKGIPEEIRTERVCEILEPVVDKAISLECKIAMYNHGGWTGNPENQVRIVQRLEKSYNPESLGIVLNFHHAHPYVYEFSELFMKVKPYLFVLNTDGMGVKKNQKGELIGDPKILPLGEGDHEIDMLRTVKESGYKGLIGVIDHDKNIAPEKNLGNNLNALKEIWIQLE